MKKVIFRLCWECADCGAEMETEAVRPLYCPDCMGTDILFNEDRTTNREDERLLEQQSEQV